jgi:hypothetical protein
VRRFGNLTEMNFQGRSPLDRFFHLGIALVIAGIIAMGFGPTLDLKLIHPPSPRPRVLYFHAALFTVWILLFVVQTALVAARRVAWHRCLGICGVVLGALIPVLGIMTAITVTRLQADHGRAGESSLIVPFFDMLAFTVTFGLAVHWRRRPEYHRRLALIAACGLTVAAIARLPGWLVPDNAYYAGVDTLILAAVARDWIVMRRVHPVYLYGLPALALGQATVMWINLTAAPAWVAIAHVLLR